MKRPRIETVQLKVKKWKKGETAKKNIIISLPKDLQMKLLSFLTLPETLVLTECSTGLKAAFTGEEVWGEFIKRISPSLLALPMNSLASTKERLKVVLGKRNHIHLLDYTKLRMHYVLEVMGNRHVATLSNPTKIEDDLLNFWSGKDLGFKIPCHRWESVSLMVLLIYDGKTSLLLPWCMANDLDENDATFVYSDLPSVNGFWVNVIVSFTWIRRCKEDSSGEDHEVSDEDAALHPDYPGYFTGIESVYIDMANFGNVTDYLCQRSTWY